MKKKHIPKVTIPLKDCIDLFHAYKENKMAITNEAPQRTILKTPYEITVCYQHADSKNYKPENSVKDQRDDPAYNRVYIEKSNDMAAIRIYHQHYIMLEIIFE